MSPYTGAYSPHYPMAHTLPDPHIGMPLAGMPLAELTPRPLHTTYDTPVVL